MLFPLMPHAFFTLPDGGKLRYARFEPASAPRGTVLVAPGRREFIEKKFAELGQNLLDQGYRLIIVESRGQGLSSRFLSGEARQRDHVADFAMHLADLRAFYTAIVVPAIVGPLILHGHSMGGHFILRWLAEDRPNVAGAFLTAPMLALAGVPAHLTAHAITWVGVRLFGHADDYAPTQHDYSGEDKAFTNNPLTQDRERFEIIDHYFTAHPDLTVGGVTWGWMLAALRSMHTAHARHYLAAIDIPVLAIVGDQDTVTPGGEITRYLNHIPRMQSHIIKGARHDIMNEIAPVRAEAWQLINAFLKTVS